MHIRARRDREDLRVRVRFPPIERVRGKASASRWRLVRKPFGDHPEREARTELNPRRGSDRLCANRFAPLQTVDRPKPGKLRDQDGRQAGCVRKHVLPSRFLIGLSRASDETRRKGLLNPSDPQLLRGRLARRPPRRRPSALGGPARGPGGSPPRAGRGCRRSGSAPPRGRAGPESVRCQRKSAIANGGFASIPPNGMADFRSRFP